MKIRKRYKKTVTLKITLPKNKCFIINLTKEVKNLNAEEYKTLIKEIKEDSKKCKVIPMLLGWKKLIL